MKNDLLTVSGEGEATAVPDTAQFSIGITKTASTVQKAQEDANEVINQITKDLKNLGVDEKNIKTTNYSVNPNYEYSPIGKNTTNGYTVNADLTVKIKPIEIANQAIDVSTKNGANLVGSLTFTLEDEKREELEEQARKEAIEKARKKAKSITSAAGVKLGKVVNVQENSDRPFPYLETRAMGNAEKVDTAQTDIQPGENTVRVTVTLSYETF